MPYKADGTGKLAQHSQARCSVPEVNGTAAQQEFTSLLREIWTPGTAATLGAADREVRRGSPEVSRSHSSGSHEPGHTPDGLTTRKGLNWADSTTRCWTETGDDAERRSQVPRQQGRQQECCFILRDCPEPPDADVEWAGAVG